jgi:hypothetical protein
MHNVDGPSVAMNKKHGSVHGMFTHDNDPETDSVGAEGDIQRQANTLRRERWFRSPMASDFLRNSLGESESVLSVVSVIEASLLILSMWSISHLFGVASNSVGNNYSFLLLNVGPCPWPPRVLPRNRGTWNRRSVLR